MTTVLDVVSFMDELYPPSTAEPWDAVGLTVGEAGAKVSKVLFAVDIDPRVVEQAVSQGAQMIITHHPLFLSGTTTVASTFTKGRMVHDLITNGIALYTAHTNADIAPHGVNDALAQDLNLRDTRPLVVSSHVDAHPNSGIGRIGDLEKPMTLESFIDVVAEQLPWTAQGIRVQGDLGQRIYTVGVCGGAGDSYLSAAAQAGVCVYLTSDLRHHRALESSYEHDAPALIDVAHFASEWPWLPRVSQLVSQQFGVQTQVSSLVTDPWTTHIDFHTEGGV